MEKKLIDIIYDHDDDDDSQDKDADEEEKPGKFLIVSYSSGLVSLNDKISPHLVDVSFFRFFFFFFF